MESFDYIILGAGLGGLSAAACLTRQGHRVAVLEKHYLPGGCCHTFDIHTEENPYPKRVYPLNALPHLRQQICPLHTYPVRVVDEEVQVGVLESCEPA